MKTLHYTFVFLCSLMFFTLDAQIQYSTFTNGSGNNLWHDSGNWSLNAIPTSTTYCDVNQPVVIPSGTIAHAAGVDVNSSLQLAQSATLQLYTRQFHTEDTSTTVIRGTLQLGTVPINLSSIVSDGQMTIESTGKILTPSGQNAQRVSFQGKTINHGLIQANRVFISDTLINKPSGRIQCSGSHNKAIEGYGTTCMVANEGLISINGSYTQHSWDFESGHILNEAGGEIRINNSATPTPLSIYANTLVNMGLITADSGLARVLDNLTNEHCGTMKVSKIYTDNGFTNHGFIHVSSGLLPQMGGTNAGVIEGQFNSSTLTNSGYIIKPNATPYTIGQPIADILEGPGTNLSLVGNKIYWDRNLTQVAGDFNAATNSITLCQGGSAMNTIYFAIKQDNHSCQDTFSLELTGAFTAPTPLMEVDGILRINNAYNFPLLDGNANQVLSTDGQGNICWQDNGGGQSGSTNLPTGGNANDVLKTDGSGNYSWTADQVNDADADPQNEIELPTGGNANDLLKTDGSGNYSWTADQVNDADADPQNEIELPTGGNANDLLKTDGSGNYSWTADQVNDADADPQNEIELPAGGNANDLLKTDGSGNYSWTADQVNDADADPQNEIELPAGGNPNDVLKTNGLGQYSWTADQVDDADADNFNELISGIFLNGTTLEIFEGDPSNANVQSVDLSSLPNGNSTPDMIADLNSGASHVWARTNDVEIQLNTLNYGPLPFLRFDGIAEMRVDVVGAFNTIYGKDAGMNNVPDLSDGIAIENTFYGENTGKYNNTGNLNTYIGHNAGATSSYSSRNTFVGGNAGKNTTDGANNTFVGTSSGENNTTGVNNVFIGDSASLNNVTGSSNTSIGKRAGYWNVDGDKNVYVGKDAGRWSTSGSDNTVIGFEAGASSIESANTYIGAEAGKGQVEGALNTAVGFHSMKNSSAGSKSVALGDSSLMLLLYGQYNVAIGSGALLASQYASNNTAVGGLAMVNNTIGINNTALGAGALYNAPDDQENVAIGYNALASVDTNFNTAVGARAMQNTVSGYYSTAVGWSAGKWSQGAYTLFLGGNAGAQNITGSRHTIVGCDAMINNVLGTHNTVLGYKALWESAGGSYNTILGQEAGYGNNGDSNVFIGYKAGYSETGNHKLVIANSDTASLIEGDFQQNYVRINDVLMLPPTDAPTSPQEGMMFLSSSENKLKIYVNGVWQTIAFE